MSNSRPTASWLALLGDTAEAEPDVLRPNQRRHLRLPVTLSGYISSSKVGRMKAVLTDLSVSGCRVDSPLFVIVGSHLTVTIPSLAAIGCAVCWCDNKTIGLSFNRPLDARVIDRLAAST
jgi:hypothetical protein